MSRKILIMRSGGGEIPGTPRGYRASVILILVTLAACVTALGFRTPIRSRYWAWQATHARTVSERALPLTNLCNAGDAGRWGTAALLTHPDEEIRQYGVVVLQHVCSDWARRRLLDAISDPSASVRELAVLGLATHGDPAVIPELTTWYTEGDTRAACSACAALGRLGSPRAATALTQLAEVPTEVIRRAALVDALAAIGDTVSGTALLQLLADHRTCDVPTPAESALERWAHLATEGGFLDSADTLATTKPRQDPHPRTIAERAAETLARITGLRLPFASDMPAEKRREAERLWRKRLSTRQSPP